MSRSLLPCALGLALAGCLGWDKALPEYCAKNPDPRPLDCGARVIGLGVSDVAVGNDQRESVPVGLAILGAEVVVAGNSELDGLSRAGWVRKHAADLSLGWAIGYSGDALSVGGIGAGTDLILVGGDFSGALQSSASGAGELAGPAAGGTRPFVHLVDRDGKHVAFWSPAGGLDATIDALAAVSGADLPRFAFVGTFSGTLGLVAGEAALSSGAGRALYGATGELDVNRTLTVSRSWSITVSDGGTIEPVDVELNPAGTVCLLARAQGTLTFGAPATTLEVSSPSLVLICSGTDDATPFVKATKLDYDEAWLTAQSERFYLVGSTPEGLHGGSFEATTGGISTWFANVLNAPGLKVAGVDAVPGLAQRYIVGTYSDSAPLPGGLRLPLPKDPDVFVLSVGAGLIPELHGVAAFRQEGTEDRPVAIRALPGGTAALITRLGADAPFHLSDARQIDEPGPHPTGLIIVTP